MLTILRGSSSWDCDEAASKTSSNGSYVTRTGVTGSGQGSAYEWQDEAVEAGITYYYWLEDVDTNGNHTTHGPVSATVNTPTAVTIGQLGTSETEGLAAFVSLMLMLVAGGWLLRRQS